MTASARRFVLLIAVVGVVFALLAFATDGTVCLVHRTDCTPADASVLRTFFLPIAAVVGHALFRISDAL